MLTNRGTYINTWHYEQKSHFGIYVDGNPKITHKNIMLFRNISKSTYFYEGKVVIYFAIVERNANERPRMRK